MLLCSVQTIPQIPVGSCFRSGLDLTAPQPQLRFFSQTTVVFRSTKRRQLVSGCLRLCAVRDWLVPHEMQNRAYPFVGPKDGNDESTIVELSSGLVLYITRSNTSPCLGGKMANSSRSRCLEFALSSDGGTSFSAVGKETVNNQLAGPSSAVSALAVIDNHNDVAHNYFKTNWKACAESTGGWAAEISETTGSSFVVVSPTATTAKNVDGGRTSWPNITIAASFQSKIYLEGSADLKCHGNPDYSSKRCHANFPPGHEYTSTCFDMVPVIPGDTAIIKFGSTVLLREPMIFGGEYLNPESGAFDLAKGGVAAEWTLVSALDPNSTDVFTGGPFALRPGAHPPPYTPPPPPSPATRPNRTLYLSHPENLAMTGRTNGTVRASVDGGHTWPWTFQVTLDQHPQAGSVFSRQAVRELCSLLASMILLILLVVEP